MNQPPSGDIQAEAALLSRYLVRRDPGAAVIARYAEACRTLFGGEMDRRDTALVGFVRDHSWSLPFLDAATGLLDPRSLLRRKLLLMLALLETVPEHTDIFLARPSGRIALLARLGRYGIASVLKIAGGLVLLPLARRRT